MEKLYHKVQALRDDIEFKLTEKENEYNNEGVSLDDWLEMNKFMRLLEKLKVFLGEIEEPYGERY
jgi:hypothetical protein